MLSHTYNFIYYFSTIINNTIKSINLHDKHTYNLPEILEHINLDEKKFYPDYEVIEIVKILRNVCVLTEIARNVNDIIQDRTIYYNKMYKIK